MVITPQTNIRFLNTPLENDRANTLTWSQVETQTQYFLSCTVYSMLNCTYQRIGNSIRVNKHIDDMYNCNYIMYQNNRYGNKWFYAFIDSMRYVNEDVTEVFISMDEFQTWYFDLQWKPSFVIREHTNDDTIGKNRIDEGLGLGAYVTNKKAEMYPSTPQVSLLISKANQDLSEGSITNQVGGWFTVNENIFASKIGDHSGTYTITYVIGSQSVSLSGPQGTSTGIDPNEYGILVRPQSLFELTDRVGQFDFTYNGAIDKQPVSYFNHNVLGYEVKSYPLTEAGIFGDNNSLKSELEFLTNQSLADDVGALYLTATGTTDTTTAPQLAGTDTTEFIPTGSCDTYVPRNNKLLCYPYTIIKLHNASDSNRVLMPELFTNYYSMNFKWWSDHLPSSTVTAYPLNYGKVAEALEYSINSAKYPLQSASYDAFKNYLGIHATEYNLGVASRLASGVIQMASGVRAISTMSAPTPRGERTFYRKQTYGTKTKTKRGKKMVLEGLTETKQRPSTDYKHWSEEMTPVSDFVKRARGMGGAGLIVNGASKIATTLAENDAKQKEAYGTIGSIPSSNLNAIGKINIYIEQQTITKEYAQRIDKYFDMYGYATNDLKVPNVRGRRNWNYVQTTECNIIGEIPNESLDDIRDLFDNGVTLWHNPATYLDYSQDNSII